MPQKQSIQISVPAAIHLVDLIQEQVRQTESDLVKKILLRAGIKIADLALASTPTSPVEPRRLTAENR